ncbi:MAG: hypothetical protein ACYTGV_15760 [Planctomycetota bacterium]|jgi:hypothetical protein
MAIVFHLQLLCALALTGLIWTVQLVHYPLFRWVRGPEFPQFHREHSLRISWIVGLLMPVELATAILMVAVPHVGVSRTAAWVGLVLVGVIWLSTALLQVPQHRRLAGGYDPAAHNLLMRSNWIRTWAWTARALLLVTLV